MPGSADAVQRAVHALEAGGLAVWVKRALVTAAIGGLALFYLMHECRGLATSQAMDQAQIGREIARGHGWRTNFIRPRAVGQMQGHGKNVAKKIWFDTYNAPLPPLVDAIALLPVKSHWKMSPRDAVYVGDRAIATMSIFLFLASVAVLYFTARRLFDERIALMGSALVLICDTLWQYSLSGLPQMLLLFLFNATIYCLMRAVQAQIAGAPILYWLAASGAGFGLLALTHALTIFMFAGALIFCVLFFRPRGWAALIMLAVFSFLYLPWLARNYLVCGNPAGAAIYSVLHGIHQTTEAGWMRHVGLDLTGVDPAAFKNKIRVNLVAQMGQIFEYLGWSVVAPMFFVALLHAFKRPDTGVMRWPILAMWIGAVFGMAAYGIDEEQEMAANQLHLLFIPIMTCYGLAFLFVLWNRLEIEMRIARIGFQALLILLCSLPLLLNFPPFAPFKPSIRWPPYVPPYISVLNDWMKPPEIIASDMPWAVSWYADRRSIWLPENPRIFSDFNDYNTFGAPVNGLYLTPISGSQNKLNDILKGEYKDWAGIILRADLPKFSLKWATLLGLQNECIFFSDHDRTKASEPEKAP
jgi:hypothetical protein